MSATAETHSQAGPEARDPRLDTGYTLDDLHDMTIDELTRVYKAGVAPESLSVLDGSPVGRMLTLVGPLGRGVLAGAIRRFAKAPVFPWGGKDFSSRSAVEGGGINRIRTVGQKWFPFETRFADSAIDGQPCVLLDYHQPGNPWFIARIRDELREVAPGLFLGPAMFETKAAPKLVLYFAIDTNA